MATRYHVLRFASHRTRTRLLLVGLVATWLAGCGGGGSASGNAPTGGAPGVGPAAVDSRTTVQVNDVTGKPISGATVTVVGGGKQIQATANEAGIARLEMPAGDLSVTVAAPSFETTQFMTRPSGSIMGISLKASGEWAIGRAFVLDARMLDRATDGSTLTFTADVAVVDANRTAIQNLASSAFEVVGIDCGWGGPRDCASDAEGNAPPSGGNFHPDSAAESFALLPPSARRPYVANIVVERSRAIYGWAELPAALRQYFQSVGGNDAASLATVSVTNGVPAMDVLGAYSRDGLPYLPIIDRLVPVTEDSPALAQLIEEAIQRAAAARNAVASAAEPFVVILASQGLTPAEFSRLTGIARQAGVRIGVISTGQTWY